MWESLSDNLQKQRFIRFKKSYWFSRAQKRRCWSQEFYFFAPTNQGLENYPAGLIKYLTDPANRELLRSVLLYHITGEGAFTTQQLEASKVLKMKNDRITTIYRALYYNFVPVVQDLTQQNINVVEGNIATRCNNYIRKLEVYCCLSPSITLKFWTHLMNLVSFETPFLSKWNFGKDE